MAKEILKVLIAEHEVLFKIPYEESCKNLGFKAFFVSDARQALEVVKHNDIFAASIGSKVPGNLMLGDELRRRFPFLPIIATSIDLDVRKTLLRHGCNYEVSDKLCLADKFLELARKKKNEVKR